MFCFTFFMLDILKLAIRYGIFLLLKVTYNCLYLRYLNSSAKSSIFMLVQHQTTLCIQTSEIPEYLWYGA